MTNHAASVTGFALLQWLNRVAHRSGDRNKINDFMLRFGSYLNTQCPRRKERLYVASIVARATESPKIDAQKEKSIVKRTKLMIISQPYIPPQQPRIDRYCVIGGNGAMLRLQ